MTPLAITISVGLAAVWCVVVYRECRRLYHEP